VAEIARAHPWIAAEHARRLVRAYGTKARDILKGATSFASLGRDFGATLTEAEVNHLMATEWARRAEDVLWRRSKLGLRYTPQQRDQVSAWMQRHARSKEGAPCS